MRNVKLVDRHDPRQSGREFGESQAHTRVTSSSCASSWQQPRLELYYLAVQEVPIDNVWQLVALKPRRMSIARR
jgi:hypothetical protein